MKKELIITFFITGLICLIHGRSARVKRLINIELSNPLLKDVCDYPLDAGICFSAYKRFYFNGDTCEEFTYKGCLGNPNNFRSKEDCMVRCGSKVDEGSGETEDNDHFSFSLFG